MMAVTPISPHYPVQDNNNRHSRDDLQQERHAIEGALNDSPLDDIRSTVVDERYVRPSSRAYLLDALFTTMGGGAYCLARGHYLDIYI